MNKTLYEEIFEATRTLDNIIDNIDTALDFLEEMKQEGIENWQLEPAILELKEAQRRLGRDVF